MIDTNTLGLVILVTVNTIVFIAYVSRLGTRCANAENSIQELKKENNIHSQELKSIGRLEGKIDTILQFLTNTSKNT